MSAHWLSEIEAANAAFLDRIDSSVLPDAGPNERLVITCMDPRINLSAIGIESPSADGSQTSHKGVIRTAGARIDRRSLFVALYRANVQEILVLGHTRCAVQAAHTNIDVMSDKMRQAIPPRQVMAFREEIGATNGDLREWIRTFRDVRDGIAEEVQYIKDLSFTHPDTTVHGAVYDVDTGKVEILPAAEAR